jgi:hypothetical protein
MKSITECTWTELIVIGTVAFGFGYLDAKYMLVSTAWNWLF